MVLPGVASIPNWDVEAHPLFRQNGGMDCGIDFRILKPYWGGIPPK